MFRRVAAEVRRLIRRPNLISAEWLAIFDYFSPKKVTRRKPSLRADCVTALPLRSWRSAAAV